MPDKVDPEAVPEPTQLDVMQGTLQDVQDQVAFVLVLVKAALFMFCIIAAGVLLAQMIGTVLP